MISASDVSSASDEKLRKTLHRHLIVVGLICLAIIGGVGGWMATASISGAVVTSGTVVVESNIKRVQHREGGIIREILVKSGDTVETGDLLIRLDDTVIRANLAVVVKQLAELGAQESRLVAERDGLENSRIRRDCKSEGGEYREYPPWTAAAS
ncbi:biotin/lipoyl-binding protein [uncultured Roseibium sp.]|uniref:biotin/lipoyl-binding protein n=1 Tax=uncultured Roseibium sp. TaxID=1936171 RepID=UPI003216C74F